MLIAESVPGTTQHTNTCDILYFSTESFKLISKFSKLKIP